MKCVWGVKGDGGAGLRDAVSTNPQPPTQTPNPQPHPPVPAPPSSPPCAASARPWWCAPRPCGRHCRRRRRPPPRPHHPPPHPRISVGFNVVRFIRRQAHSTEQQHSTQHSAQHSAQHSSAQRTAQPGTAHLLADSRAHLSPHRAAVIVRLQSWNRLGRAVQRQRESIVHNPQPPKPQPPHTPDLTASRGCSAPQRICGTPPDGCGELVRRGWGAVQCTLPARDDVTAM